VREGEVEGCGIPVVGLDRERGSLGATSEVAERGASSDDKVDRERGSLEVTSEVAERGASSEYLDEDGKLSEIGELFSLTSIVAECGTIGGFDSESRTPDVLGGNVGS
jgi:hypothetical protein